MSIPMSASWQYAKKYIDEMLAITPKAKELILVPHLEKCLEWGLKLNKYARCALKISLYGHDIERAFADRALKENYKGDYKTYKKQHSLNSANKLAECLSKIDSNKTLVSEVYTLTKYHDVGFVVGLEKHLYSDLRLLRDADAISFLDDKDAIETYIAQNGIDKTKEKMRFMFNKLSKKARGRPEVGRLYENCMKLIAEKRSIASGKIATIEDFL